MENIYVKVLEKNLVELGRTLDPNTVFPHLIADGVLTLSDYETLDALDSTERKVFTLITILTKRGKNAYSSFIRSLQKKDFNRHLADTLLLSEEAEKNEVKKEITDLEDDFFIPEDEDFQVDKNSQENDDLTFDDFLKCLGLEGKFPCMQSLSKFSSVKDPQLIQEDANIVDSFWQRLSALDYRAQISIDSQPHLTTYNMQDMIFAVIHCSDCMLRQDILEKMSTCQLAVPIILSGIKDRQTEFLNWSIGRIVKRWREENSLTPEQYISTVPLFTVGFMRIGEISGVSKSSVVNYLLGQCQGNRKHSFFLSADDCRYPRKFASGCVEAVCYTPVNSNGTEKIKWATNIVNLRGDSSEYLPQVLFLCKTTNLIVVFIAAKNRKEEKYATVMKQVMSSAGKFVFVAIDDERNRDNEKLMWTKRWLLVHKVKEDTLCNELCRAIMDCHTNCTAKQFQSISQWGAHCPSEIKIEDCNEKCNQAKQSVSEILKDTKNVSEFKRVAFPLHAIWKEWVAIDRERLKPDSEHDLPIELIKEDKISRKKEKRALQVECGLSSAMKKFMSTMQKGENDQEFLAYFVHYFQQSLFQLEDECTKESLKIISDMFTRTENLNKVIEELDRNAIVVSPSSQQQREEFCKCREEFKAMYQQEIKNCKENNIGWEFFLRELGQWFEAHSEDSVVKDPIIAALPVLAANLLINGYPLEIMDGDTGRIPLSWVTNIFISLACNLGKDPILVLSVVGVQSSGKSTLLNTMFGVRFPVRAGRCTRGLFLHLLKVDEDYTKKVGAKYIFLIDSEGVRSLERTANFDNELVTLALCISDISILNIEGENISTEMSGLLEIAAHALMKMKAIDMPPQCRIVQQRVSDLAAGERNRLNMNQVLELLDKATVLAAKEEGYEHRYQKFAHVFDLRREKDFRFVPCLWTSPMSPPNELYSYTITKVKEEILTDIETKRFVPQFTISTFLQRIRDVWVAVKEENFLFAFKDSIKAVDFNEMCKEFNQWVNEMRFSLITKQFDWQRRLRESKEYRGTFECIVNEISTELDNEGEKIHCLLRTHISNHERKDIERHEKFFKDNLACTVASLNRHILALLEHDRIKTTFENDSTGRISKIRTKLRNIAKEEAALLREMVTKDSHTNPNDLQIIFERKWKHWTENIREELPWGQVSEHSLQATCESLLMSLTTDMAISTEIGKLLKDEGGISYHVNSANWKEYYPHKGGLVQVEDWFALNEVTLQKIIDNSISEIRKRSSANMLDENVYQYVLQNALSKLSTPHFTSEPPHVLKAKLLLHICAKTYVLILEQLLEVANSVENLIEKEKNTIQNDFIAFVKGEDQIIRAMECIHKNFVAIGATVVKNHLRTNCLKWMLDNAFNNMSYVNYEILKLLCSDKATDYINYLMDYSNCIFNSFINSAVLHYGKTNSGRYIMQAQSEDIIRQALLIDIRRCVINAKTQLQVDGYVPCTKTNNTFREWLKVLLRELSVSGLPIPSGMEAALATFSVLDLDRFISDLSDNLARKLEKDVLEEVNLPTPVRGEEFFKFIVESLGNPIGEIMKLNCFQQCPFCGAPCQNPLPVGPQHQHFSFTHLPHGFIGQIQGRTQQLAIDDCTICITSSETYSFDGEKTTRLFKDYKKDFPNWEIKPVGDSQQIEATYWKWALVKHNKALAKHYNCKPAKIPASWRQVTKEDALKCLEGRKAGIAVKIKGTIEETIHF